MPPISLSEILSRFVLYRKHVRIDNSIRPTAFMPDRNGETSVFRTSEMSANNIWNIGREVAIRRGKPLIGRADIITGVVVSNGLQIVPQEPPEKHANIIGWSSEKSKQKEVALILASEATFHRNEAC